MSSTFLKKLQQTQGSAAEAPKGKFLPHGPRWELLSTSLILTFKVLLITLNIDSQMKEIKEDEEMEDEESKD